MKTALFTFVLTLGSVSALPYTTTSLPTFGAAPTVQAARATQMQAGAALARLKGDPVALRPDLMDAETRLAVAAAGVTTALLNVQVAVLADLSAYQEDRATVRSMELTVQIATVNRDAARVKVGVGAITRADWQRAQDDFAQAQRDLAEVRSAFTRSQDTVRRRLGTVPTPARPVLTALSLDALIASLTKHPQRLEALAHVARAELDLTVKSTDLSAPVEVAQARTDLDGARAVAAEVDRALQAAVRGSWSAYGKAVRDRETKERELTAARGRQAVVDARAKQGLVSRIAVLQSRLDVIRAEEAVDAAWNTQEAAWLAVKIAANLS